MTDADGRPTRDHSNHTKQIKTEAGMRSPYVAQAQTWCLPEQVVGT
jgi:hypothetical protein